MTTDAWRTPRAPDPGGPCSSCPPADPAKLSVSAIQELLKSAPDKAALILSLAGPVCGICKGTGHVRVCSVCDGHAVTSKSAIKIIVGEQYEEQEEVVVAPAVMAGDTVLREAQIESRTVTKTREVEQDAWADGPSCVTCGGSGLEPIPAPVPNG